MSVEIPEQLELELSEDAPPVCADCVLPLDPAGLEEWVCRRCGIRLSEPLPDVVRSPLLCGGEDE